MISIAALFVPKPGDRIELIKKFIESVLWAGRMEAAVRKSSIEMEGATFDHVYKIVQNYGMFYVIMKNKEEKAIII